MVEDLLSRLLGSLGTGQMMWIGVALLAGYMLLKDSFPQIAGILKSLKDRFWPQVAVNTDDEDRYEPLTPIPLRVALLANLDEVYEYFDDLHNDAGKNAVRAAMGLIYSDPLTPNNPPSSAPVSFPLSH